MLAGAANAGVKNPVASTAVPTISPIILMRIDHPFPLSFDY
jgi:hypothetical protein